MIDTLIDKNGNILYPQSTAEAILVNEGISLQDKLNDYDSHQHIEQVFKLPEDYINYVSKVIYLNDINDYSNSGIYTIYSTDINVDDINYTSSTTALTADLTNFKSLMKIIVAQGVVFPASVLEIIYVGKDDNDFYFTIPALMSAPDEVVSKTDLASSEFGIEITINDENALQINDTITITLGCELGWKRIEDSYDSIIPTSQQEIPFAPDIVHYVGNYQPKQEGTETYLYLDEIPTLIPGNTYKKICLFIFDPDKCIATPSTNNIQINQFTPNNSMILGIMYANYGDNPIALRYMLNAYGNATLTYNGANKFLISGTGLPPGESLTIDALQLSYGLKISYTNPLQVGDTITLSTTVLPIFSWQSLQTDSDGNAWFVGDVYVGSTEGIDTNNGSKKLATEEYVDNAVTNTFQILNISQAEYDALQTYSPNALYVIE